MSNMLPHNPNDLIKLFNNLFSQAEETILIGGSDEPLYLPKNADYPLNQVIFKHDYFSSAPHEIFLIGV